jgi:hypothetical protein
MMNPDYAISSFLNSFVGRSPVLDETLTRLMGGTSMFSGLRTSASFMSYELSVFYTDFQTVVQILMHKGAA